MEDSSHGRHVRRLGGQTLICWESSALLAGLWGCTCARMHHFELNANLRMLTCFHWYLRQKVIRVATCPVFLRIVLFFYQLSRENINLSRDTLCPVLGGKCETLIWFPLFCSLEKFPSKMSLFSSRLWPMSTSYIQWMEQIHASHRCVKKNWYTFYNPDWAKLSEFEWVRPIHRVFCVRRKSL